MAPYVDVSVSSNGLPALASASGARELTLGFVVAGGHRCNAAWGGGLSIADANAAALARREPVAISFGGRDGPDLAGPCSTRQALAAQYESVIGRFHATEADFDVENGALANGRAVSLRSEAIAAMQARARTSGRPLAVSLTLPAEPSGLTVQALAAVRSALAAGVRLARVNVLAMDYGQSVPARAPGRMGRYAIATATAAERQLQRLRPASSPASTWPMIGVTTMIGRNDTASEVFTATDAKELLAFARAHRIGSLSFWSLSRDRPCPGATGRRAPSATCSGVAQAPYEFTHLFDSYG